MKFGKSLIHAAASAVAFLALTTCASADIVTIPSITGTVWRVAGNLGNAPTSAPASPIYTGHFSVNHIDFLATGNQTLNDFLLSSGATSILYSSSNLGNQVMSNPGDPTAQQYSTVIELTGTFTFQAGVTYTVHHDDGGVLFAGGNFVTPVINSPAPTVDIASTWTPAADTSGAFQLWYMGTNGNPEVLSLASAVPEPGSIMLLGTVLLGVAGLLRRKVTSA